MSAMVENTKCSPYNLAKAKLKEDATAKLKEDATAKNILDRRRTVSSCLVAQKADTGVGLTKQNSQEARGTMNRPNLWMKKIISHIRRKKQKEIDIKLQLKKTRVWGRKKAVAINTPMKATKRHNSNWKRLPHQAANTN